MITKLKVTPDEKVIVATTDIVYGYRTEFCGAQYVPLKMTLLKPRVHFSYDQEVIPPVIVFLCGGGWSETDHNAWLPELSWFAKKGFAVASVQYPVTNATRHPDSLNAVKSAIQYLVTHHSELRIDTSKLTIMGESAGAYLALLTAASRQDLPINEAVAFYPPIGPMQLIDPVSGKCTVELPNGAERFPSLLDVVGQTMPRTMILHGTSDQLVPVAHGIAIYEKLQALGVESDLLLIENADHAENHFFQPSVKQRIIEFLNKPNC